MSIIRKTLKILIKLILAIFNYNLTIDKKKYLRLLIKNNNLIINELKSKLSYFFNKIFVNFNLIFYK